MADAELRAHCIRCMDSWARDREIATYTEMNAALTQLAFMARTSGTPTPELLRACEGAEALIAKTGELHG